MKWTWIIGGAAGLAAAAALTRSRRQEHQHTGAQALLRRHFPRIARMRLVGACPGLDDHLQDRTLEPLFDWMVGEMCRRSGACDFPALMQWAMEQGQPKIDSLASDVSLDALERLPRAALNIIDECHGRTFAAAVLDLALSEAAHRAAPELKPGA